MGSRGPTKKFVKKKGKTLVVGSEDSNVIIPGNLIAQGNIIITAAYQKPAGFDPKTFKVLHTDGINYNWETERVQTIMTQDSPSGFDYFYVNSSRGFFLNDEVIINPFGATRETGTVSYQRLETKVYLKDRTINPHYIGETIIKI